MPKDSGIPSGMLGSAASVVTDTFVIANLSHVQETTNAPNFPIPNTHSYKNMTTPGEHTHPGDANPDFIGDTAAAAVAAEDGAPLDPPALVAALRSNAPLDGVLAARSLARLAVCGACSAHTFFERLSTYCTIRADCTRETVVAAIAELATAASTHEAFTKQAAHALVGRAHTDDSPRVRVQALGGVRHLAATRAIMTHLDLAGFSAALAAVAHALADANSSVSLAAFAALIPLLATADQSVVVPLLPLLSEQSRAAAEHDNEQLRACGFETFAWLSRAAATDHQPEARQAFTEHAHALLPLLLLHADHPDVPARMASLAALRSLEPWFGLGATVLPTGVPGGPDPKLPGVHPVGPEWLAGVCASLVRAHPQRLPRYTTAMAKRVVGGADAQMGGVDPHVRSRACGCVGALLSSADWERDWVERGEDSGEMHQHAVHMLVSALRDTDKDVRREAAKALGVVGSAPVGGGSP